MAWSPPSCEPGDDITTGNERHLQALSAPAPVLPPNHLDHGRQRDYLGHMQQLALHSNQASPGVHEIPRCRRSGFRGEDTARIARLSAPSPRKLSSIGCWHTDPGRFHRPLKPALESSHHRRSSTDCSSPCGGHAPSVVRRASITHWRPRCHTRVHPSSTPRSSHRRAC